MIYGTGAPKFYIYDSTGVTLQKTITMSTNIMADKPIIDELRRVNVSPYTKTKLLDFDGYYFRQTLTAGIGDYYSTLQQYQADQANSSRRNDIFKLQQVLTYCNSGYVVKYTPHADLEDLWGFSPMQVFVSLEDLGYTGTNKTDSITVTVEGNALRSSAFLWYEFSFTELNGVTNANQCIDFNGTDEHCTVGTPYSISTTHTIEFWTDSDMPADGTLDVFLGTAHTGALFSYLAFTGTGDYITYNVQDGASNYSVQVAAGTVTSGTKHHWIVIRSGASVSFYKDGVQLSTTQTLAGAGATSAFTVTYVASLSAGSHFFAGKMAHLRIAQTAYDSTQRALQYNAGYGNYPIGNVDYYAIYEMDGTGGVSTTEDNQETTATRDLTLVNTPTRTTW